jgi:hypothetical protein
MSRVTAVFANRAQAEEAIAELRRHGVTDSHLSIVARRVDDVEVDKRPEATAGERVAKGAITGVGVGVLFGLAAVTVAIWPALEVKGRLARLGRFGVERDARGPVLGRLDETPVAPVRVRTEEKVLTGAGVNR